MSNSTLAAVLLIGLALAAALLAIGTGDIMWGFVAVIALIAASAITRDHP